MEWLWLVFVAVLFGATWLASYIVAMGFRAQYLSELKRTHRRIRRTRAERKAREIKW